MEFLYLVDRTITRFLKRVSRFTEGKLKLPLWLQQQIMLFLVIVMAAYYPIDHESASFFEAVVMGFPVILAFGACVRFGDIVLKRLHVFFDPENAIMPNKLYGDGYFAWAMLSFAIVAIWLGLSGILSDVGTFSCIFLGSVAFIDAYPEFVRRAQGSGRKRKRLASQVLEKFLEVYRKVTSRRPAPQGAR